MIPELGHYALVLALRRSSLNRAIASAKNLS
jgi:hypothetical protein